MLRIKNPIDNKLTFKKFLIDNKLKGSIIFSLEGINGSISGKQSNIDLLIKFLKEEIFIYMSLIILMSVKLILFLLKK